MSSLLLSVLLTFSGSPMDKFDWFDGTIVTKSGQIVTGNYAVAYDHETLLVKNGKGYKAIPAFKINTFAFNDTKHSINRKFKVLEQFTKGRKQHEFYEVVTVGKVEIIRKRKTKYLRRQELEKIRLQLHLNAAQQQALMEIMGYHYYILKKTEIYPVRKLNKKKLLDLLDGNDSETSFYIKLNNLNMKKVSDYVQVVNFHNEMYKSRHAKGDEMTAYNNPMLK